MSIILVLPALFGIIRSSYNDDYATTKDTSDIDCITTCAGNVIPSRVGLIKLSRKNQKNIDIQDNGKMILIKGGKFSMGSSNFPDAQPIHDVTVSDFWIDEHEVTNAQFAQFVKETGYVTVAERPLDPKDFPGVDQSLLVPGSAVFTAPENSRNLSNHLTWWQYISGACWNRPEGPGSTIEGKENHPVVHVAHEDAEAYAKWAGKRLPTESEWEYAAKGATHADETYYWGANLKKEDVWQANIFQGEFPLKNTLEDGYATTAPVKSFPANGYGLYDMSGNVWEWCADYYQPQYVEKYFINPKGPVSAYDPQEPGVVKRVQRGGSFLCSDMYCERYKAGARGKGEISSSSNHVGFRCAKDAAL
ncbi:formylglycine-generating enzyme family protein [Sphingobacterium corticibacterium]|uniref:Formylglycine-generating enzyme family protein n=2 Tax=Sphingobacterium corticibacterium TaxID=2484746 RepID=A0A4Q6XFG1_9SPHI|nr:formylglycine-generating enzyme family protein [Sphingobacterium corticibacterium]